MSPQPQSCLSLDLVRSVFRLNENYSTAQVLVILVPTLPDFLCESFLLPSGSLLTEIVFLTAFCKSYFVSFKADISLDFERNFSLICQPPRKKNKIDKSDVIAGGRKDVDASPGKGTMSFVPDLMTLNCCVNKE